jgi:membrane fusion protein (multidrug efflux system)
MSDVEAAPQPAVAPKENGQDENGGSQPAAARRPWAWPLIGALAVAAVAAAVVYYFYSLGRESTDDAFIEGHIVPVSSRVAGHVAKVYVSDNQWVRAGELLLELDAKDFEARLAGAEAGLAMAQAGHNTRSIGADVTEITSTAGVDEARAAVEGARADVATGRAAVAAAESQVAQAKAQLTAARAGLEAAQADVRAAEARRQLTRTHLDRIRDLVPQHAVSQQSFDESDAADRVAEADLAAARQRVNAQEATVKQGQAAVTAAECGLTQAEAGVLVRQAASGRAEAKLAGANSAPRQVAESRSETHAAGAQVDRAAADLKQAKLNLSYTKIFAPTDGHITRKSIEPGAYVQVGQALLALVEPDVWVVANFKETQLTRMRPGQPAVVQVDAYPGVSFAAHVDSIQRGSGAHFSLLPPENATGNYVKVVQRVPVKIVFDDPRQAAEHLLGPGMSVVPTVNVRAPQPAAAETK